MGGWPFWSILVLLLGSRPSSAMETAQAISESLLDAYGPTSLRPQLSSANSLNHLQCTISPPEEIRVQTYIEKYYELDMQGGSFSIDGYLRVWWSDPRLRFNGTEDGGCVDKLSFGESERARIWKPILYWEGAQDIIMPSVGKGTGELLEVYPDGSVWWSRQAHFTLACPFAANLGRMPFDTQTCNFMVGMYADTALDSQLRWKEGRVALANHDGTACLNEWFVTGFSQAQLVEKAVYPV